MSTDLQTSARGDVPRRDVRLTLHLTTELNERLDSLALELGGSKSDLLRKAIALVQVAVQAKRTGRRLSLVDAQGQVEAYIRGI